MRCFFCRDEIPPNQGAHHERQQPHRPHRRPHHLEDQDALLLLKELARVGRWGWAVTDLKRSRFAYAAVRLLSVTAWRRHPFPREDGPVSIRRSFTPAEIRTLTRRANGLEASVETRFVRWAARGAI